LTSVCKTVEQYQRPAPDYESGALIVLTMGPTNVKETIASEFRDAKF
jgi:hypothetical protein